jgi:hypothetical protein
MKQMSIKKNNQIIGIGMATTDLIGTEIYIGVIFGTVIGIILYGIMLILQDFNIKGILLIYIMCGITYLINSGNSIIYIYDIMNSNLLKKSKFRLFLYKLL